MDKEESAKSPQDSNTEKHVDFRETEESGTTRSKSIYQEEENTTSKQWREMREEKLKGDEDLSLQSPQDANTEKHINSPETEGSGSATGDSSDEKESPNRREWREMREEKNKNNQDVSLQSPQDANTEKHINFLDEES